MTYYHVTWSTYPVVYLGIVQMENEAAFQVSLFQFFTHCWMVDADRAVQQSLWLSFLIHTSFAICMEYYHLSRIGVENDEIART